MDANVHRARFNISAVKGASAIASPTYPKKRPSGLVLLSGEENLNRRHLPRRLNPSWAALARELPDAPGLRPLRTFLRLCTKKNIEPADVTQALFDEYRQYLAERMIPDKARRLHRRVCGLWNEAQTSVATWPQVIAESPEQFHPYLLNWNAFPPSLKADLDAYLAMRMEPALHDELVVPPISEVTAISTRWAVKHYASALVQKGMAPTHIRELNDLFEAERFVSAAKFLVNQQERRSPYLAVRVLSAVIPIARWWTATDPKQLRQMRQLRTRLKPREMGLNDKSRDRLRRIMNDEAIRALVGLPRALMREADAIRPVTRSSARLAEMATIIELLLISTIRVTRLCRLRIDKHIQLRPREGKGWLEVPNERTGSGVPLRYQLPRHSVAIVQKFIDWYRPNLVRGPSPYLIVGSHLNRPRFPVNVTKQVRRVIADRTGLTVTPTMFRHLAAALHLRRHPGQFELVSRLLGHRHLQSTVRLYGPLNDTFAMRRYHNVVVKEPRKVGRGRK
ncbi:MAG: site-specific integrase [Alphaproteobacteria bacterium]